MHIVIAEEHVKSYFYSPNNHYHFNKRMRVNFDDGILTSDSDLLRKKRLEDLKNKTRWKAKLKN
jgi:hypothetical protein